MNTKSSGRFKFSFKNNYEFNYFIIIDIIYLNSKLVFYIIDIFMFFQAASFLKDILRIYLIDTYLGPLDNIIHDIGKNFVSVEFRQYTKSIVIQVQEIPVKTYNFIRKIK
jgi:hypothetical protein